LIISFWFGIFLFIAIFLFKKMSDFRKICKPIFQSIKKQTSRLLQQQGIEAAGLSLFIRR